MRRLIGSVMLGLFLVMPGSGCDVNSTADLNQLSKALVSARSDSADAIMTQLQTRDRLKDGTGVNCPTARQIQNGGGQGDLLRLRDASCQE